MESKFIPTLQVGNGYTYLKLRGVLDEDNLLVNLLSQIQGRLLLIDLAELERINSCGVRDWVNWLNQIQALGLQVILLRCSAAVVAQANMVTNFAADAFIHSFYAPYVHPDTGDEQNVLLFTEDLRQVRPIRAPKIFNENGEELEFDEFEESYFAFVNDPRILSYQVPADIQSVIQYFLPEAATHQPVLSSSKSNSSSGAAQAAPANPRYNALPGTGPAAMKSPMTAQFQGAGPTSRPSGFGGVQQSPTPQSPNVTPQPAPGAYAQPQRPATPPAPSANVLPQPATPMRHKQPPLPSNNGYQQAPSKPNPPMPAPNPAPAPLPAPATKPAPVPVPAPVTPAANQQPMPQQAVSYPSQDKQAIAKHSNLSLILIVACIFMGVLVISLLIYWIAK